MSSKRPFAILKTILACLLCATLVAPAGASPLAGAQVQPGPVDLPFRPGAVMLKFKPQVRQWERQEMLADFEAAEETRTRETAVRRVAVPVGREVEKARQLAADPRVQYAEVDHAVSIAWTPTDPDYDEQWGLPKISAPSAWNSVRGAGVTVAVIDTGADLTHPDLAPNLVEGYRFVGDVDQCTNDFTPNDDHGHGTHVSGIVAAVANNDAGGLGVAPQASIMPLKALDCHGSGYYSNIVEAIEYAADNGAQVINMSLAGSADDQSLRVAVDYAWSKGVLIVAAAGNAYTSTAPYPAGYGHVMAVGATTLTDAKASFSNYGSYVSVGAPGNGIYSTYKDGQYAYMSGTSMASPMVAGLAALIFSSSCAVLTNADVRHLIESNADNIDSRLAYPGQLGHGRVNAARSLPVSGAFALAPRSLLFMAAAGATQTQQRTVNVSPGECTGAWSPTIQGSDTGWLSAEAGETGALVVTADSSTLASGQYTATISLMPASGSFPLGIVPVSITVASQIYQAGVSPVGK